MNQPIKYTFGKAEKLKSRKQIDALFAGGKSFFIFPFKVFYQIQDAGYKISDTGSENAGNLPVEQLVSNIQFPASGNQQPASDLQVAPQIGVTASSRNFKHAADRNRIKRLMREGYRLNKNALLELTTAQQKQLYVFFVFVDKTLPTFALVEEKMKACIKKLRKQLEEQP